MRKSGSITVTVLAGLMLTLCCVNMSGCGGRRSAPDHTWYDAAGNRIEEKWKTDATGNKVLDAEGRPIPDPHVPYDSYHRPWVFTNGVWAPLSPPAGSSTSRSRSGSAIFFGGSGYRSFGGSSSSGSSGSSSPSSISRGGFGSTGGGSSSS